MNFIADLVTNTIFLSSLIAMIISQLCKLVLTCIQERKFRPLALFNLAGMPSAHTATAIAALSIIYFEQGVSTVFMVMFAFVIALIDILLTVDRSLGVHAAMINTFLEILPGDLKVKYQPVRTEWGHKLREIVAGGFIGYAVAYFGWNFLG